MPQKNVITAFEEYKGWLTVFVRKRLAIKDDAEDIVQEIFYLIMRLDNFTEKW
jgi:DNA-directed RNA polymerase specialized sigma24 family protein